MSCVIVSHSIPWCIFLAMLSLTWYAIKLSAQTVQSSSVAQCSLAGQMECYYTLLYNVHNALGQCSLEGQKECYYTLLYNVHNSLGTDIMTALIFMVLKAFYYNTSLVFFWIRCYQILWYIIYTRHTMWIDMESLFPANRHKINTDSLLNWLYDAMTIEVN